MRKRTVITIVGARPQFIKAMPLVKEIKRAFRSKVIHTGQHYDHKMSRIFFRELDMQEPDYNLAVGSGPHGAQTAEMLKKIEKVIEKERPSLAVVFGDTNSTLAGALAAAKMNIPLAHVEAGLRSFRRSMPEEVNRIVSDSISSILFCPTDNSVKNLRKEGITDGVFQTGDVMADALKMVLPVCRKKRQIMDILGLKKKEYFLLTLHRDYNTDDKNGLKSLIKKLGRSGKRIVFPVHPRTGKALKRYGLWGTLKADRNITLIDPVGYVDSLTLQMNAGLVITDSGGVQKEAYLLKIPCLTLRDETEWIETLKGSANRLGGRYGSGIRGIIDPSAWKCSWRKDVFGSGNVSHKMVKILERF